MVWPERQSREVLSKLEKKGLIVRDKDKDLMSIPDIDALERLLV